MAGFFDTLEQALLNHIFTDPAYTPPATLYVGLSSTTPTEAAGNITEPSTGSYARVATTAADWSAAAGTAPATKTNTATIAFPAATADWLAGATLTHAVVFTAASAGTPLVFGPLAGGGHSVLAGQTARFLAGGIVVRLGDPGDF